MNISRASFICLGLALLCTSNARAAFLFEVDTDGADDGVLTYNSRFSFGGDTTSASQSITSTAIGTNGADSIFGGDGVALPDTYVYKHAPDAEPDNLVLAAGTDLGEGDLASGLIGGVPGKYAVYATWPFTSSVSGGPTQYEVGTAGDNFTVQIDQNGGTDGRGHVWVLLGQLDYASGDITVTQTPTVTNSFVSQRAYGLLFERVPEPGSLVLAGGLAGVGLLVLRRRQR